jgi:hypothetical protein
VRPRPDDDIARRHPELRKEGVGTELIVSLPTTRLGLRGALHDVLTELAEDQAYFDRSFPWTSGGVLLSVLRRTPLRLRRPIPLSPRALQLVVAGPVRPERVERLARAELARARWADLRGRDPEEGAAAAGVQLTDLRQELHPGLDCKHRGPWGLLHAACPLGTGSLRAASAVAGALARGLEARPGVTDATWGVVPTLSGDWALWLVVHFRGPFDRPAVTTSAELRDALSAALLHTPAVLEAALADAPTPLNAVRAASAERPYRLVDLERLGFPGDPPSSEEELSASVENCGDTLLFQEWTYDGQLQ